MYYDFISEYFCVFLFDIENADIVPNRLRVATVYCRVISDMNMV